MRGSLSQGGRMDISNYRLVEYILDGAALSFDASDDVSVGVAHDVKFAGGKKLRGNIMAIPQARLLRSQGFEKSSGFLFAHTPLKIHVPLRVLEIDTDSSFPPRRQQVFVSFRRLVEPHQLRVVGHGVKEGVDVDPVAVRVFESIVIGGRLGGDKPLSEAGVLHKLYLKAGGRENIYRETSSLGLSQRALQNPLAGGTVERWFDGRIFLLEGINQGDDLLVIQRAVKNDFAFDSGGLFQGCRFGGRRQEQPGDEKQKNLKGNAPLLHCFNHAWPTKRSSMGNVVFMRPCSI